MFNDVGAPEDVFLSVFRNKKILKVPAGRLFPHEAASNKLFQLEVDYTGFAFPPSQLWSEWVPSTSLGVRLMKTRNKQNGFHDRAEWADLGVGDFMVRLQVEPSRDPDQAIVRLHALPGDRDNLSTYRGNPEV